METTPISPKLITIDLDGTLLRNDCTISSRTREAMIACMENTDVLLVPCTGRSYRNSRFVLKDFPVFPYYLNANGTTLVDGPSEKLLHASVLPWETGCQVYTMAKEYRTFIEIYHGLTAYDSAAGRMNLQHSSCSPDYVRQLLHTNTHLEDLDDFVLKEKKPISKFHIVCPSTGERNELKERLAALPGVFPVSTTDFNIEISCMGWSKWDGLKKLCELVSISTDRIAAIGDSENDYEMILGAGSGIAMGNAEQKVKQAARYVTGTNEEDGVLQALRYLGL